MNCNYNFEISGEDGQFHNLMAGLTVQLSSTQPIINIRVSIGNWSCCFDLNYNNIAASLITNQECDYNNPTECQACEANAFEILATLEELEVCTNYRIDTSLLDDCYTGEINWNVNNPNSQFIPFNNSMMGTFLSRSRYL